MFSKYLDVAQKDCVSNPWMREPFLVLFGEYIHFEPDALINLVVGIVIAGIDDVEESHPLCDLFQNRRCYTRMKESQPPVRVINGSEALTTTPMSGTL